MFQKIIFKRKKKIIKDKKIKRGKKRKKEIIIKINRNKKEK